MRDVTLSNGLERVGENAFYDCDGLESIKIPKSLIDVYDEYDSIYTPDGAFNGCSNLKTVSFQEGSTVIADSLFRGCDGIEKVIIPNTITEICKYSFSNCKNLADIVLYAGTLQIDSSAFENCTSLTQITLPDTVTAMGTSVFSGCSSLTEVHLPNTWEKLMESTFYNCKKLAVVNFPSTLKNIQKNAFYGCETLTEAVLPSGLEKIENSAFQNCSALKKVVVPDTVTVIGSSAFYGCESLTEVTLGSSLKAINSQTFYDCTVLPSIIIPYNVESIGDSAFVNCTKLTQITIPRKTTSIASNAFSYPKKMTIYAPTGSYAQEYASQKGIKFVVQDIAATSVSLNVTSKTLERDDGFQLMASIAPQNFTDEVVWTSSDEKVATVSENGYVEACGGGQAVITVTVGAVQASCTVTVEQYIQWMEFTRDDIEMEAGETCQLEVEIYPDNATNKELEYTSSNPAVAEVSASGAVTAKKKGETRIKAMAKDDSGEYAICYVTVTGEAKVSGISLDKKTAVVKKGEVLTLQAKVMPDYAANKNVTWKSSNTKVATVDNKGKVTGKNAGKTTITVSSSENSSYQATCTITVPYNITYILNKGKNNSGNPEYYYNQNVTLKNPTRNGYIFKGWYTDKKYKNKIKTISKDAKKDYTLYAKWEKVKVAKAIVKSAKNSKSKQILLKYKKVSGAKGYEISYSIDKKFKKTVTKKTTNKTSYTIKKLKKGKTYYVRVRAYKMDSAGKKVYGKYSSVKKVRITR